MKVSEIVLGVLVTAAGAGLVGQCNSARDWESRARQALAWVAQDTVVVDSLKRVVAAAQGAARHVDTVRVVRLKRIAVVDSVTRPDSTCLPSLVIRDSTIQSDTLEIGRLWVALGAAAEEITHLSRQRDSLRSVLVERPRMTALTLELLHPRIQISAQVMVWPQSRLGLGLSIPLMSFKL